MVWICLKQDDMGGVCPRSSRRHPLRRKNCALILCGILAVIGIMQLIDDDGEDWQHAEPLGSAESEARRLLKLLSTYQLQCNSTFQLGNHSAWPLCTEYSTGIDLETQHSHRHRLMYTVGWEGDFSMERTLAGNFSFQAVVVSSRPVIDLMGIPNITVINTVLVPNDYADFSRNSYGQQTLNALWAERGVSGAEVLRLAQADGRDTLRELLHFLVNDGLLAAVNHLQIQVTIDKLDEDYLYSWYRTMQAVFHTAGYRIYHTTSNDPLCSQVTMMQSCIYYVSLLRHPGPNVLCMHPPAGFGDAATEERRLVSVMTNIQDSCTSIVVEAAQEEGQILSYKPSSGTQWHICRARSSSPFTLPCTILRFRLSADLSLSEELAGQGCKVYTLLAHRVSKYSDTVTSFKLRPAQPALARNNTPLSWEEIIGWLAGLRDISVVEIDAPGVEWDILTHLLDTASLHHVNQLILVGSIPDHIGRRHPTSLRRKYSELQRLRTHGFHLVYSENGPDSQSYTLTYQSSIH